MLLGVPDRTWFLNLCMKVGLFPGVLRDLCRLVGPVFWFCISFLDVMPRSNNCILGDRHKFLLFDHFDPSGNLTRLWHRGTRSFCWRIRLVVDVLLNIYYDLLDIFCHACGEFVCFGFRVVSFVLLTVLVFVIVEEAKVLGSPLVAWQIGAVMTVWSSGWVI